MAPSNNSEGDRPGSVDWLFAGSAGDGTVPTSSTPAPSGPAVNGVRNTSASSLVYTGPTPPPESTGAFDVAVAYEWLRAEQRRLEEYTRGLFARIHQDQQAALAKYVQNEQVLALRQQESNRQAHFLNAQAAALRQREEELRAREQALAARAEEHAQVPAPAAGPAPDTDPALGANVTTPQPLAEPFLRADQPTTDEQRSALEGLQAEVVRLREAEAAARAKLEALEAELHEYRRSGEQKEGEIKNRHAQIDQRYRFLEKAEAAVQRRLTELEEYERSLLDELDEQERRLTQERRELQLHGANAHDDRGGSAHRPAAGNARHRNHR